MELDIIVQSETGSHASRIQADGPFVIGRDATAALRMESGLVSRKHVVIQPSPGGLRVQDQSRNGTLAGSNSSTKQALTYRLVRPSSLATSPY